MTKVEEMMAARRVWVLDLQGEGEKAYDNEIQVFSNEEACESYFVKLYGKRIHGWPDLNESEEYAESVALEKGEEVSSRPVSDDFDENERHNYIEEMITDALVAYEHAKDNLGGHPEHGYIFRVIKTDLIDDAAELWD